MEIKTQSLNDFVSTADLIKKGQENSGIQTVVENKEGEKKEPEQTQLLKNPLPEVSAFDLLKKVMNKEEGGEGDKETENTVVENKETENTETTVENKEGENEEGKEAKKAGRPSNKLPEGFSELIKEAEEKGLLVGFEDGKYESINDFFQLIEANFDSKKDDLKKEAQQEIISSFNPVQQSLIQFAGLGVKSVQDLIPMLTAMDNFDYTMSLDVNNPSHHEEIVRQTLGIQGLPSDIIESEIAELKAAEGKLETRAKTYKPTLDKYNEQQIQAEYMKQQQLYQEQMSFWKGHEAEVRKTILEKDVIGGLKYSRDERVNMYMALAKPDTQSGGLPIYALIDKLIESKDFETLGEIYQLGTNKKSYRTKLGSSVAAGVAESTQRALRTTTKSTPMEVEPESKKNKLNRPGVFKTPSLDM